MAQHAASSTATSSLGRAAREYPVLTRAQIEAMIADGRKIVIVDQYALKVDAWLPYHPGGAKAILHMVGKDATDEVNGLHSPEARKMMEKYRIGQVEGHWKNFLPPIQGGVFSAQDSASDGEECHTSGSATAKTATRRRTAASAAASSRSSSRSASPSHVFDSETDCLAASSSSTDGCDGVDSEHGASKTGSGSGSGSGSESNAATAFLDTTTREEIQLDLEKYPALDADTQQEIVRKYRALHDRLMAAGLFDCDYTAYAWETARYLLLFMLSMAFLRLRWYVPSAICLGMFWHQLVFAAHDSAHMAITHNFQVDSCIAIFIANYLGGLSVCWWKDNHNVHHIVTNSPEHDPDIEHMPLFAISHRFLQSLRSTYYERVLEYDFVARAMLSIQAWSYYPILCFGRFNLYRLSWLYIILGKGPRKGPARWHRWLEAAGQVVFWIWFGYGVLYCAIDTNWDRFVYVMVSHIVTMPLHVQITLSHFAMSTADLGPHESFPQRMLRTTMDVDCPTWLDFFHGGLQFQAIHHMYPRMPRHNFRKAQKMVQDFCNDVGIPYALYGFVDGNKQVIGRLAEVSRQAAIFSQCQRAMAEGRA